MKYNMAMNFSKGAAYSYKTPAFQLKLQHSGKKGMLVKINVDTLSLVVPGNSLYHEEY